MVFHVRLAALHSDRLTQSTDAAMACLRASSALMFARRRIRSPRRVLDLNNPYVVSHDHHYLVSIVITSTYDRP